MAATWAWLPLAVLLALLGSDDDCALAAATAADDDDDTDMALDGVGEAMLGEGFDGDADAFDGDGAAAFDAAPEP